MGQFALGQSDYRIFKSNISLEQNDEMTDLLPVDTNLSKLKIEKYWGGCGHSGHRTQKLAVSQEAINGINRLFAC